MLPDLTPGPDAGIPGEGGAAQCQTMTRKRTRPSAARTGPRRTPRLSLFRALTGITGADDVVHETPAARLRATHPRPAARSTRPDVHRPACHPGLDEVAAPSIHEHFLTPRSFRNVRSATARTPCSSRFSSKRRSALQLRTTTRAVILHAYYGCAASPRSPANARSPEARSNRGMPLNGFARRSGRARCKRSGCDAIDDVTLPLRRLRRLVLGQYVLGRCHRRNSASSIRT